MKTIKRHKTFEKHFRVRIATNQKLVLAFQKALSAFVEGNLGYPLNDHGLTRKLAGKRAFSVTGDIRVVYIELEETIILLDIGTHNQVY